MLKIEQRDVAKDNDNKSRSRKKNVNVGFIPKLRISTYMKENKPKQNNHYNIVRLIIAEDMEMLEP